VAVQQQADFVGIPLTISSEQKDPDLRNDELRQARALVIEAAKRDGRFFIQNGPVRLSTRSEPKFGSFSMTWEPPSQSDLSLLIRLPKENPDIYACASAVQNLVTGLQLPSKAKIRTSPFQLIIENPEQYRLKLVLLIGQQVKSIREQLSSKSSVTISGLQRPVTVRKLDEVNVELYIPYEVSITFDN
jgi:hypothetical protein